MINITENIAAIAASAARTTSGNQPFSLEKWGGLQLLLIRVQVTAVSGTSPTLDLYLQESFDAAGTTFVDVAHFTQITGVLTNPVYAKFSLGDLFTGDAFVAGVGDATSAANSISGVPVMSNNLRLKWVIGGTTPSFTFAVNAIYF